MQLTADHIAKLKYLQKLALISVASFALAIFFFAPHFAFWKGLHIDFSPARNTAEVNRAQQVLKQLRDPFTRNIDDFKSNRPILWRLFFPIVGHYLHFPDWLFLALPHIGCFFVLGYIAHLTLREKNDWRWAFFVATIVATCSWFWVATGWLTYNDSWYLLGLLMISFSRSRIALAVVCLIEPFIDERFVLGLPLGFVLRIIYFDLFAKTKRKQLLWDFVAIAALTLPYVILRLVMLKHDEGSTGYIADEVKAVREVAFSRYLFGLWMGLRAGWVFVVALFWLVIPKKNWLINSLLIATVIFAILVSLLAAADIGRSSSALVPAALLGLFFLIRQRPAWLKLGLPIVMIANLLLPAEHVITLFTDHIFYVYREVERLRDPPLFLQPDSYTNEGMMLRNQHRYADARKMYDTALQLDDRNIGAYLQRALVDGDLGEWDRAEADADWVLLRNPQMPDALLVRGVIYLNRGDRAQAKNLLEEALKVAPENWPQRSTCQSLLQQLGGSTGKSDFGL